MIEVKDLTKSFGSFRAVDHVGFEAKEGELMALLGPSGSGKSTILRLIAGLEQPDGGDISLAGERVNDVPTRKRGIGFVFQNYALFKHMTIGDNIAFGLTVRGEEREAIGKRVEELLKLINLREYVSHYPHQLSGGQRQRVALARALAPSPRLLLLDEPFGSLDAKVRYNLGAWLKAFHAEVKVTSLFVTHDQKEAMEIADRIVLINRGKVEQIGPPREIYDRPATKFVASFIGRVNVIDAYVKDASLSWGERSIALDGEKLGDYREGEAVLLVRPEDVELERGEEPGCLPAIVTEIRYLGDHFEVILDVGGVELKGVVSNERMARMKWAAGEKAGVRLSKYNWFPAREGLDAVKERLKNLGYIE